MQSVLEAPLCRFFKMKKVNLMQPVNQPMNLTENNTNMTAKITSSFCFLNFASWEATYFLTVNLSSLEFF